MRLHWGCLDRSGCKVKRHKNNKFFGESSGALLIASSYLRLKCDWQFFDKWLNFWWTYDRKRWLKYDRHFFLHPWLAHNHSGMSWDFKDSSPREGQVCFLMMAKIQSCPQKMFMLSICYSQENIEKSCKSHQVEDVLVCLVLPLVLYVYTSSNKQHPGLVTGSPLKGAITT